MKRNARADDAWDNDDEYGGDDREAFEGDQEEDAEEPTIRCPYCRREIHEDSVRCPHCENYLSQEDASPQPKPWWILVGAVIVLCLVFWWIVG